MRFGLIRVAAALVVICGGPVPPVTASTSDWLQPQPPPRRAFVAGMQEYASLGRIPSGRRDAELMAKRLERHGFQVSTGVDESHSVLWQRLRDFQASIHRGDVVVFYFSGHGFQWEGLNYLVPADGPDLIQGADLTTLVLPLRNVIQRLRDSDAGFSLVIVDACRENTLTVRGSGGVTKAVGRDGLAAPRPPAQLVVAFATDFGQIALSSESDSDPSLYTKHLARHIRTSDEGIHKILRDVAIDVSLERPGQEPETRTTVAGNFYLRPTDVALETERAAWRAIMSEPSNHTVRGFLRHWPAAAFAWAAREWLAQNPSPPARAGDRATRVDLDREVLFANRAIAVPEIAEMTQPNGQSEIEGAVGPFGAELYEAPNRGAARIGSLPAGAPIRIAARTEPLFRWLDREDGWRRITLNPGSEREQFAYVPEAVATIAPPERVARLQLRAATKEDILTGKLAVEGIDLPWWPNETFPEAYPLARLSDLAEASSSLDAGDLGRAVAGIRFAPFVEGATSTAETQQLLFLRALQVRDQLVHAGLSKESITIEVPATASIDREAQAADTLLLIIPNKEENE